MQTAGPPQPPVHVATRFKVLYTVFLGLLSLILMTGCGSGSASQPAASTPNSNSALPTVSPANAVVSPGATLQFTASFANTAATSVVWSASSGTISSSGLFTAPNVSSTAAVSVTAASAANPSKSTTVPVTVQSAAPLAIETSSLAIAIVGSPFSATLEASGGKPPYKWTLASGSLPAGITLSSAGTLTGTPSQSGTFSFVVRASDSINAQTTQSYSLNVAANSGGFDGPAQLPLVYIQSSLADTPAPGSTVLVSPGGNLQSALNAAECGQTIALQAGATFSGQFTVPALACDDAHWIIIRTSSPDSALPPEGSRITPCYAGVASLPGRPRFACPSTKNVMAKIVFAGTAGEPILLASGANHIRFLGLEITRSSPGKVIYDLVLPQNGGPVDHLVFDRVWIHGTAQDETTRGIALSGTTYVAVVDSFFSDFHCIAITGSCGDAQTMATGLGDLPMGPYKIVGNFLEAAGENLMFGGGEATQTPEDIEIRQNHFFKPLIWMRGQPGYVGGTNGNPFIVKNHLEFKNGIRVLFEGNVLENTWGGFTQVGFSILLTPKDQSNACPLCVVHDVTIRYNTISHVGGGMQIANGASDSGGLSQGAWNESIHDVVIDDIDAKTFNGDGYILQESNGDPLLAIHDVVINHLTVVGPDAVALLVIGNDLTNPMMNNFTWTNSIFAFSTIGVLSTGGGSTNCAFKTGGPMAKLAACFSPYAFSHNAIIGATGTWPSANYTPATANAVQFVNYNNGSGGNYQLQPTSPFKNAGLDGNDLGADMTTLNSMIAGVAP
ncbi:MAG: Ig domain-containing protein [Candidatus Sulfotelmatobacter sp.]